MLEPIQPNQPIFVKINCFIHLPKFIGWIAVAANSVKSLMTIELSGGRRHYEPVICQTPQKMDCVSVEPFNTHCYFSENLNDHRTFRGRGHYEPVLCQTIKKTWTEFPLNHLIPIVKSRLSCWVGTGPSRWNFTTRQSHRSLLFKLTMQLDIIDYTNACV